MLFTYLTPCFRLKVKIKLDLFFSKIGLIFSSIHYLKNCKFSANLPVGNENDYILDSTYHTISKYVNID